MLVPRHSYNSQNLYPDGKNRAMASLAPRQFPGLSGQLTGRMLRRPTQTPHIAGPFVVRQYRSVLYQPIKFLIMRKRFFLLSFALVATLSICYSQNVPDWNKWSWLIGNWIGEGGGQPGQGNGTFSFSFDLDKNILVRKSHSEYPSTAKNPKTIHDDLMIIYINQNGEPDRAVYFDNEKHTIFYSVTFSDNSIILTSEKSDNSPIFRLVYSKLDKDTVNIRFEMSQDGFKFIPYVEGKSKKIKPNR